MNEQEALLALIHAPHLGPVKLRLLLQMYGSAVQVLQADPEDAVILPGFKRKEIDALAGAWQADEWKRDRDLAQQMGVAIVTYQDPHFPKGLSDLPDAPVVLYMLGRLPQQHEPSIAVVGTRRCSVYGSSMTEKLSSELVNYRFTIVSGLARGIDTCAHRATLESKGRTLAVIGSGLAKIYPKENQNLARTITEHGALLSEYPLRTPPDRQNFPQRNRLVAAMSHGSLLVEAPIRSGAMITMRRAQALHRPLFALPGRVDMSSFAGNHTLIKEGAASLVENAEDIAQSFGNLFPRQAITAMAKPQVHLQPEELTLLQCMPTEETSIDELVQKTQLPVGKLNVLLMSLLLKKMVTEYPGKRFMKRSTYRI